jgi:hypothetical protein
MSSTEDIQQRGQASDSVPVAIPFRERAAMLALGVLYAGTLLGWLFALGWTCKWLLARLFG